MRMTLRSGAVPKQFPTVASPSGGVHPRAVRWISGVCSLLAGLAFFLMQASAQEYRSGEYELKAAILFNLLKFVEWPASAYSSAEVPTVLCTLGQDPFGSALNEYSGKGVNGRPLSVRRLQRDDDAHGCHLVYISSSERKVLTDILTTLKGGPILTLGEMDQFATRQITARQFLQGSDAIFSVIDRLEMVEATARTACGRQSCHPCYLLSAEHSFVDYTPRL